MDRISPRLPAGVGQVAVYLIRMGASSPPTFSGRWSLLKAFEKFTKQGSCLEL
jgi:hypothetical protein